MGVRVRFFVTGMGRSGTLWLARLLDCDKSVTVMHEATANWDADRYGRAYRGQLDVGQWLDERQPYVENHWRQGGERDYGEVNSYLRYIVPELQARFECPVAGLVRDGRMVVRSLLARGCYQRPGYPQIPAPYDDPFEACCWYWADAYERLDAPTWRLEDLNGDYGALCELGDYLGVTVTEEAWKAHAGKRANVSVADEELPQRGGVQAETFERLAGDVQAGFGYGGNDGEER